MMVQDYFEGEGVMTVFILHDVMRQDAQPLVMIVCTKAVPSRYFLAGILKGEYIAYSLGYGFYQ